MQRLILASLIVFSFAVEAHAERLVEEISWARLAEAGSLSAGQVQPGGPAASAPGQWWGNRTGGWLGGITGGLIGCIGATTGVLAGMGRGRRFVLTLTAATIVFGVCVLILGGIALVSSQPYAVWYPLTLTGVLSVGIFTGLRGTIRKRYEQAELRRMAAADVE